MEASPLISNGSQAGSGTSLHGVTPSWCTDTLLLLHTVITYRLPTAHTSPATPMDEPHGLMVPIIRRFIPVYVRRPLEPSQGRARRRAHARAGSTAAHAPPAAPRGLGVQRRQGQGSDKQSAWRFHVAWSRARAFSSPGTNTPTEPH